MSQMRGRRGRGEAVMTAECDDKEAYLIDIAISHGSIDRGDTAPMRQVSAHGQRKPAGVAKQAPLRNDGDSWQWGWRRRRVLPGELCGFGGDAAISALCLVRRAAGTVACR